MPWIILVVAGLLEIVWAYFMKQSHGFTRAMPTAFTLVTGLASFCLLAVAMKSLPLGTSYMVWTGIGAVGTFVVGIALLGEAVTIQRLTAAALLVAGLILMKVSSSA